MIDIKTKNQKVDNERVTKQWQTMAYKKQLFSPQCLTTSKNSKKIQRTQISELM